VKIYLVMSPYVKPIPCPPRILISYFYFYRSFHKSKSPNYAGVEYYARHGCDIFVDSGAYSAWTSGTSIAIGDYINFLKRWRSKVAIYANLDNIQSSKLTDQNQRYLESEGLAPLPVYHMGEDESVLEGLCERFDLVCCGGTGSVLGEGASRKRRSKQWHFDRVFKIAQEHGTKIHGFGITDFPLLKAYPWYSVDSSSWARPLRFGNIPLFDPRRGTTVSFKMTELQPLIENRELLQEVYGVQPKQLLYRKATRVQIAALSIKSWLLLEEWLTKREQKAKAIA